MPGSIARIFYLSYADISLSAHQLMPTAVVQYS